MSKPKISRERLMAYAAGELGPQESAEVERVVAKSPEVAATVARYRLVQATMRSDDSVEPPAELIAKAKAIFSAPRAEAAPGWWQHLEQVVAALMFDSRAQPALAGYRGSGSGFQLSFESDKAEVDLQAEPLSPPDHERGDVTWRLMGQVNTPQPEPVISVALVASDADEAAADTEADEHGVFTIDVEPGRYDLMVRIGDTVVVLKDLEIA